ncbi:30S ribosome-binding factor RbfA [Prochlorococcus sp. MIT 1341]|uniref:30S ribosome-binding factor RbfA n=1 Tax=Prochlorococcus sp. MIT 1341 TaxID=3096221 RepID=UPI002A7503D7|nr:30S ribosome-binding factor RbfA [Prochlorococcus sp. MIT 1341]
MMQSRRLQKVASLIKREVSELLVNGIRDARIQKTMVTITEVELSGDLQHCKIFVSIFGEAGEKEQALDGLQAAQGFLKGELGRRLKMRRAPEVVFQLDRGIEKGASILTLLSKLEEERKGKDEVPYSSNNQP